MTAMPKLDRPRIKPLPPLLINQLAAGEIVTRPASVVKELMENAIDSGATRIVIKITQGGTGLIEVTDNGCGIHPDDMIMAVTRFATSKIADVANLQGIRTLGFRGEALASTAAVSRLTLCSSHDDSGIGRKLTVAGILDDTPVLTPVVHNKGTTVTVKDLYFNVPARRGNLKSIATEFAHIETVIQGLAMAVSHINIELWHNDKKRYDFTAIDPQAADDDYNLTLSCASNTGFVAQILQRLSRVDSHFQMGRMSSNTSAPVDDDCILSLDVDLSGLLTNDNQFSDAVEAHNIAISNHADIKGAVFIAPTIDPVFKKCNAQNLPKLIYINGRLVKDALIAQHLRNIVALINAPSNIPTNAPMTANQDSSSVVGIDALGYVLFFNLPQAWLNINVHPSKQRIGIGHLPNILAHLDVALTSRLRAWQRDFKAPKNDVSLHANLPAQTTLATTNHDNSYQFLDPLNDAGNSHNTSSPACKANQYVHENVQAYQPNLNKKHKTKDKDNGRMAGGVEGSPVKTANPVPSPQYHKNPRAIMWIAKSQLQKLQPTPPQHVLNNDSYLLIQDTVATSVVSLQHLYTFLNQHHPALDSAPSLVSNLGSTDPNEQANSQQLNDINQHLAQWFYSSNNNANSQTSPHQHWQRFINTYSLASLNHEHLLPLLFESSHYE